MYSYKMESMNGRAERGMCSTVYYNIKGIHVICGVQAVTLAVRACVCECVCVCVCVQ